ncbi:hypothetical protein FHR83_001941 [Actinoplanes campanulatus]|uniref:GDSL-like Lipase/Acylhydrolase family protein n=1 Tax=Actinoplanes campanulatus TaxID=113559 RepID=A0A7W5AEH6_9ACTN|nr:hypothetical protein [Actinoplanes campanulatus]MBB3094289.1 hypothetical protein [Actinoplanes campanulatus]GGN19945.1 hypothetical protein GCM10010109_33570 [Actinoplanes campanulatus]GID35792.1 hypothetical protein Aca09nite_22980 [Actinoplanes campanulatus]
MRARHLAALAAGYLAAEYGVSVLVKRLKPVFPWLITPADLTPPIPPGLVERHVAKSFDPELGWCRRPGEHGDEATDRGRVGYAVDQHGRRRNPGFEQDPALVACFGDSFTFCRLVADDQTWPHHLSRALGVNAANYGVGNYGLDQALLRLERELPHLESRVVVMGVVPETIARVHSYWKHYFEYGNVLAFKPRFTLGPEGLRLHAGAVREPGQYATYRQRLAEITALDPFHAGKFRPDLLHFPYLPKLVRRARRHLPVLAHLTAGLARGRREEAVRAAFGVVLRDNARWTARLYADPQARRLMRALVERFAAVCRDAGRHPVLLIIPQLADLERGDGATAHHRFAAEAAGILPVVDLTGRFRREPDRAGLFSYGRLGPHCSDRGNALVAEELRPVVGALLHSDAESHAG